MKSHNKSAIGYNSKPIWLASNSGTKQDLNNTPGLDSTSEELPMCISKKNFSKNGRQPGRWALVLGLFVRSSVRFSSSKANSSSGSVRLIPQARFGFAVRFALGKRRTPGPEISGNQFIREKLTFLTFTAHAHTYNQKCPESKWHILRWNRSSSE